MSRDSWTSVRVSAPANQWAIISALFALGAEGVQELDGDVLTHLRGIDRARVHEALVRADAQARVHYDVTPSIDWSAAWRERLTAHRLHRLVVTPPWLAHQFGAGERIVIDPGMAFGTGDHESTRCTLRLMEHAVRPGDVVADLGSGSGVLAIAAARLGARGVIAIEIDADAIGNAESNVATNGVADVVSVVQGDAFLLLPLVAPVRVVTANIVSSVLVELLPVLRDAISADGEVILGGLLVDERDGLEAVVLSQGWTIRETDQEGSWWSATIARR